MAKTMKAKRNRVKKRSLHAVNEHFEFGGNAASAAFNEWLEVP